MGKAGVEKQNLTQFKSKPTKDKLVQATVQSLTSSILREPNKYSILVADDDLFYFSFIETILFPYNYKIIHAKDGQEAVNVYHTNNDIKVILMDIQMPVMDGLTATMEIRKINPEIPIIAHSSFSIGSIKEKAISSGCNDFLSKPAEPEVLTMMINQYLRIPDEGLFY